MREGPSVRAWTDPEGISGRRQRLLWKELSFQGETGKKRKGKEEEEEGGKKKGGGREII